MGQALYRKYRSKSLSEIVGQEHITETLESALKKGAISHAYLFTGPRGVGKTSIARILAHEVNNLPYEDETTHLDIIEIDAASNRRIDEIREIRERVHNAPASAKYKVYIIDEVHMLTREAFNALLKTLEEPPAHAIFILATTEAHKLPETIVSRTQRYSFKPVEEAKVVAHLKSIAKAEKISIDDDALQLVAQHGEGSFRDSIGLLDQLAARGQKISLQDVQSLLGIAPTEAIDQLIKVLQAGDARAAVTLLGDLREQGYQAAIIAKQTAGRLRQSLLEGSSLLEPLILSRTLQQLLDVPAAHDPDALLELTVLEVIMLRPNTVTYDASAPVEVAQSPTKVVSTPVQKDNSSSVIQAPEPEPQPSPAPVKKAGRTTSSELNDEKWQEVLAVLKKKHNTLYGITRMAVPIFQDDKVTLCFKFAFHQKRLNDAKNSQLVADVIEEVIGKPVSLDCVLDASGANTPEPIIPTTTDLHDDGSLDTISNIFGGAEVLE